MTEVGERYGRIADAFDVRLVGIGPEQWDVPTPCNEWDVKALVDHVIRTHEQVLAGVGGAAAEGQPAAALGDRWSAATEQVRAALSDPASASTTVSGMFGEQPFESLVSRLLCADTLFHTWDLARATGQDERLDPDGVVMAMEFLTPLDEAIRRPGGFAPKIEPATGADPQTRLLNFGGRSVD
ncbi:MAG TPA: TIGR03086 family metal-binding protein [Acidimicrobiales bacterium]|nr:TIGR03086 family metal-binding protein [Acidimicrobiales bacterium]